MRIDEADQNTLTHWEGRLAGRYAQLAGAGLNLDGKWWSGRLGFHAALSHTGQRLDDFFDASFTPHRVQLGSYTLLTLAGHYELSPAFSIHARVENALGERYEDVYGFNTPGAAAYLGLRVAMQR